MTIDKTVFLAMPRATLACARIAEQAPRNVRITYTVPYPWEVVEVVKMVCRAINAWLYSSFA